MHHTRSDLARLEGNATVIVSAMRTPTGRRRGSLSHMTAAELGAHAVRAALARVPRVVDDVAQVIFGNVYQGGAGQNVARQVALGAGLAVRVPAMTVNEVCGSGLKSVILAEQLIRLRRADVVVAGGTESMTRAALVSAYDPGTRSYLDPQPSLMVDGLTDAFSGEAMGVTAEEVAKQHAIDRASQDAWALRSHERAAGATRDGLYAQEIAPVDLSDGERLDHDEPIRPDTDEERLAGLRPVFAEDGTVTAGNASSVADGAAALVVTSADYARRHGLDVMAVVSSSSEIAIDPQIMGFSPTTAIRDLLSHQGLTTADVDSYEINEAFAATSLAVSQDLDLDPETVNPTGSSIALGHPLGASGARILVTLVHRLRREGLHRGVASLCVGGGMGIAVLVESLARSETVGAR